MNVKVLMVSAGDYFSTYGGGQVYVQRLVAALREVPGITVSVLSDSSAVEPGQVRECEENGVTVYQLNRKNKEELVESLIQRIAPDVVHAHGHKAKVAILCSRLGIPCVVTAHHGGILCPAGTLLNSRDAICSCEASSRACLPCVLRNIRSGRYWYPFMRYLPHAYYDRLGRALGHVPFIPFVTPIGRVSLAIKEKMAEWQAICEKATLLIAPSEAMAEAMLRNGALQERLRVIPHGVPEVEPSVPERQEDGKFHFFYVGRISHIKGLHVLLKAFHHLSSPDVVLHLLGGTGNKAEARYFQYLLQRYERDERIIWHGKAKAETLPSLISQWDVMVAPSICLEVFGLTISEALMMDKPVLATRCGGAEMQIVEGRNGWLVPPNSARALYEAMEMIVRERPVLPMDVPVVTLKQHAQQLMNVYEEVTH